MTGISINRQPKPKGFYLGCWTGASVFKKIPLNDHITNKEFCLKLNML